MSSNRSRNGGGAHIQVAANQMMDGPVPEGRKTGEEYPGEMIHTRKERKKFPDGGRVHG